jgi:hypothetical protein
MSLAQARKQLKKGSSKKSPPELMPISSEHTPPYSNFVSNVDNRDWRNGLSSEPMYPHQEARNTTAAAAVTAPAALTATMTERVQKRVLDVFLDVSLNVSSPATKKIAAKVHAQLARKDPAFTSVVDQFQDIKCSQFFDVLGVATCNGIGSVQQQQLSSSKISHGAISSKCIIIFSRCITYLNNCLLLCKS